jgi:hypothetical protein
VALTLRGVTNAYVQPGLPTTAIIGTAQGINTVQVGGEVERQEWLGYWSPAAQQTSSALDASMEALPGTDQQPHCAARTTSQACTIKQLTHTMPPR